MKFIVDESSGAAVAEYLRSMGHNVLAVAEVLSQANDQDILARVVHEGRIVVTNYKDFGELIFRTMGSYSCGSTTRAPQTAFEW